MKETDTLRMAATLAPKLSDDEFYAQSRDIVYPTMSPDGRRLAKKRGSARRELEDQRRKLDGLDRKIDRLTGELRATARRWFRRYGIVGDQSSPLEVETLLMLIADFLDGTDMRMAGEYNEHLTDRIIDAVGPERAVEAVREGVDKLKSGTLPPVPREMPEEVARVLDCKSLLAFADWAAGWKASGYARMSCGQKLAAALMLTDVSGDVAAPWSHWSLIVPDDLIDLRLSAADVYRAFPAFKGDNTDPNPTRKPVRVMRIWCSGPEPDSLLCSAAGTKRSMGAAPIEVLGDRPERQLLANYVKGVCLSLDADVTTHRTSHWGPKKQNRPSESPPEGSNYVLGTTTTIDLRDEVRRIVEHGVGHGQGPRVQFLVRGHWRNQVCGAGRVDRRRIWIEPFWKGPEDARILLRTHRIRTSGEAAASSEGK